MMTIKGYAVAEAFLKFYDEGKKFGFLLAPSQNVTDIHVGAFVSEDWEKKLSAPGLKLVRVRYGKTEIGGKKSFTVTEILDVKAVNAVFEGEVKFFNQAKGFGFVVCEDFPIDIFLPLNVAREAGVVPASGMKVVVEIEMNAQGAKVTSLSLPDYDDESEMVTNTDDGVIIATGDEDDEVDTGPTAAELGEEIDTTPTA